MSGIATLEDIASLREDDEVECKLAQGRDGKGELPKSFWETYSAFANTRGGYIFLGLREIKEGVYENAGVTEPEKLKQELFNQLNNRQKVSVNLLTEQDVSVVEIDGKSIISIRVPPGSRQHKPVFLNGNPLTGTYRRLHDGDRLCDEDAIKRFLAEQTETSRDDRVLVGFDVTDLSQETVDVYRRSLRDANAAHPFLEKEGVEFLRAIRAWRNDRETGREGLTVAGLLMFGTSETIRDEFPNYALDYQERDEPKAERWIDRITTDGTWSGNVLDFYRVVWRKLISGLKVPFQLKSGQRQEETPAHTALREAFVNALVHADYTGRSSILVVRRPDMFGFRNPGLMRVPVEVAIRGGESDGRNRVLQQMFLLIGAGERAGSGVPKIHKGWRDLHWRPPSLYERQSPSEQTLLELRMEDLLPSETVAKLQSEFGSTFDELLPEERVVLVTASLEATVSHARAMALCDQHPADMTRLLQGLVARGFLMKSGQTRGTRYHLPGAVLPDPNEAFAAVPGAKPGLVSEPLSLLGQPSSLPGQPSNLPGQPSDLPGQPSDLPGQPSDLPGQPSDLPGQPSNLPGQPSDLSGIPLGASDQLLAPTYEAHPFGKRIAGLHYPLIDDLAGLDPALRSRLQDSAAATGGSGKVPADTMRQVILSLCHERYMTLRVIAAILGRDEDYLRTAYLNPMASRDQLQRAFPQAPNDPRQAYAAKLD